MRQNIHKIARQFYTNQNGATAIIYALSILPLMLMLGFAIDFSRVRSVQTHMQASVDGATLASALGYADNVALPPGERLSIAEETFEAIYSADIGFTLNNFETLSIDVAIAGEDGIRGTVQGRLPLAFGGLFGRPSIDLAATSSAQASPPQRLEVVLVLDNTTSMFTNDRFNLMRGASKGFVNQLFDGETSEGSTSIGIVPWATLVNINSERPGGFDTSAATDRTPNASGSRSVPNDPFEDRLRYLLEPEVENRITRDALEQAFAPVAWRGCIRSAPNERVFSGGRVRQELTDAPVDGMRWHTALVEPELQSGSFPTPFNSDDLITNASFSVPTAEIVLCEQNPRLFNSSANDSNVHIDRDRACLRNDQIEQIEACVSDPNEHDYFRRGGDACPWTPRNDIFPWTRRRPISGPNQNCPVAMLGLSESRGQIIDKLDEMYPVTGGTHMDVGLMWGLRIMSPQREWASFFGHDRPSQYADTGVRKIMILLTDGQNQAPGDIEGYYGCLETADRDVRNGDVNGGNRRGNAGDCWRAPGIDRLNGNSLNALTSDACDAITNTYGVELFTIAVDIDDNQALNLLSSCAGNDERAFNIRASELDAVFETIAAQELRLLN